MKVDHVVALMPLALLPLLGWIAWDIHETDWSFSKATHAPLNSAPAAVLSALGPEHPEPNIPPPGLDEQNARAVAIKNDALARCETSGGIPAMGFGFTVICLQPQCVSWTREPHFPPFESGVK